MSLKHIMKDFLRGEMLHFTKYEKKRLMYNHIISYQKKHKKEYPIGKCALYNEDKETYECCGWNKKSCGVYKKD